jgi:biotin/methionine sulfoxide reductase
LVDGRGASPTGERRGAVLDSKATTHALTSLTHWGGFTAGIESGDIAPSRRSTPTLTRHRCWQLARRHWPSVPYRPPAVRRGWLRDGPGPSARRGADEFVAVSWDELTELLAGELRRVVDTYGNEAIYGGSYGWASAGRFHHAQSQVHRFLKLLGGYTFSRHSYSLGATGVIMPRVMGTHDDLFKRSTAWEVIVEHTDLLVCFGGLALKNTGINHGGTTGHPARDALRRFRDRGGRIVSFSPLRDDVEGECEWHAPVPGTDVAIMLALAYVLATESLADRDFLSTYCTGYDRFERYLLGVDDGSQVAAVGGIDMRAARRRSGRAGATDGGGAHHRDGHWSLQRIRHGEQAVDGPDAGGDAGPDRPLEAVSVMATAR